MPPAGDYAVAFVDLLGQKQAMKVTLRVRPYI